MDIRKIFSALQKMGNSEINGHKSTGDPLKNFYSEILSKLRGITWEDFENLTEATVKEVGFYDVHRLSRGSQQGKDIIATWISRFTYGRELKIRFQCKHTCRDKSIKKTDVGDAITDFLSQEEDDILVIVTNATLSNDLIDSLDKLAQKGVFALPSTRAVRFFCTSRNVLDNFIDLEGITFQEYRNYFDAKHWFESLISLKEEHDLTYSLNRFWTEPYTWFFHQNHEKYIERMWTTSGGEFCLSIHNNTSNLVDLSGLKLTFIGRDELPDFGILNTTGKGSHDIPIYEVILSKELEETSLIDEGNQFLKPGSEYFCLIDFKGIDPGIYHFQFKDSGNIGTRFIRESHIYSIVYLPEYLPKNYIHVYESWPNSLLIIEKIFEMTEEERGEILCSSNGSCILFRDPSGKVFLKYPSRDGKEEGFVPDMPSVEINNEMTKFIYVHGSSMTRMEYSYLNWRDWCEEALDSTEPIAPIRRAMQGLSQGESRNVVLDSLFKAHERAPFFATANYLQFLAFKKLGYDGFAKFHLNLAYINNPQNPEISANHFLVFNKKPKEEYLLNIPKDKWEKFEEELK